MASSNGEFVVRGLARLRHLFGITNTQDLAAGPEKPVGSIHYGMFSNSELRHVDGVFDSKRTVNDVAETDIISQLKSVSSNSKKMIDEIETLKMMAPEISMAETIIVSSIMSPTDLQTDMVTIAVDAPDVSSTTKTKISELLTNYFNDEFRLGPRLVDWLGSAGFHDGAKAVMVLPQSELDILNTVADQWNPIDKKTLKDMDKHAAGSTEGLDIQDDKLRDEAIEHLTELAMESLNSFGVGSEFMSDNDKKKFEETDEKGNAIVAPRTKEIAKDLINNSFRLLKPTSDGCGVIVTRDISSLSAVHTNATKVANTFASEAEKQIFGFHKEDKNGSHPQFPVLHLSDIIKTNVGDMPVLMEFPVDSVIPVCAPGDNKNHLGYFILINEYGQPIRGEYAFDGIDNSDVTHRLATNAARAVFGNRNISSFQISGMTDNQIMDNVTRTFSVAVNYLLRNKLNKDGLKGLNINVHEAVGKALFYNLLAKNRIKMVFVPEPMMTYIRFDHRDDGTGKSFLEDIKFLLAMRCTLMVAKVMAAIDNATKHRVIEVQVDNKNTNPREALELARQMFISKKAPNITNDPRTAAESIINQHLSIRPKGMQGVIDDLSITHETQYGQSQAPADDLLDTINNMIGQGIKVPPTVLNNLNEAEYARSVATSNLFFANNVRNWQAMLKPHVKKFLVNYVLCSDQLKKEIEKIIEDDIKGSSDPGTSNNTSDCIKNNQDKEASDCIKNNQDKEASAIVTKILSSIELVLSPPNMSTSKAHFEELNAQADAIEKLLNLIYPDDAVPADELKSFMSALRAIVASKLMRDFLPKLGVHEIADIPAIDEIDADKSAQIAQFLANLKNRFTGLQKLMTGQLPPKSPDASTGDDTSTSTSTTDDGGEPGSGSDDEMTIPGF